MKFTNVLLVTVLGIFALSSCTSLTGVVEAPPKSDEQVLEPLTPMQAKVLALNAMPNLYKQQTAESRPILSPETRSQFEAALLLQQQGKLVLAKNRFIAMSEQHPNLSGIWLQLALLAKQQDTDDIAQKNADLSRYLNNAIAVNPLNYLAHNELALLLRQQGQFQSALSHYDLALKSWPAFAQGYLNRGILYDLYMGKKTLALADYALYQALANDDSRQLKGWIIDLQRQIKSAEQLTQNGAVL